MDVFVAERRYAPTREELPDLWDDAVAGALDPADLLVYRSRLLGSDKRITNFGGGNTSSKLMATDLLTGAPVNVLWVKGSGGDLGSIARDGFATLDLARLRAIESRYDGAEDDVVALYAHCAFNLNPRAASIDTPLHGLVRWLHIDHVHPDAIIAIAAATDGEAITRDIFGDAIGWIPWRRPGFELGLQLKRFVEANPHAQGVILGGHGLITWADDQRACYRATIAAINRAIRWLGDKQAVHAAFGGRNVAAMDPVERRAFAAALAPRLRGLLSEKTLKVAWFDDSDAVLDFVCGCNRDSLAAEGTSCPDHFLRTKVRPLLLDVDPARMTVDDIAATLAPAVDAYRRNYRRYYDACRRADSPPMRDDNPVIVLIPGVGMFAFAGDRSTARIASEYYRNAINVMRGATAASTYRGLPEQEAFDIEYWLLEEAKLKRLPPRKPIEGKIGLVTGAAGGIGFATARRLLDDGACVALCDIDETTLGAADEKLAAQYGRDRVARFTMDVTREASVIAAFADVALAFGGLDILVSNAGIASAAPIDETTLELWTRNQDILSTGYFLVAREGFRLMKAQGRGGSIVFVASKNGLVASANAAAYGAAKAAEIHLARCLALEGAQFGIRANVVNPDAVLRGSRIWTGEWRAQRAQAYKVEPEQLEEVYRQRSMLKLNVLPEDVAEAACFFASDRSAKSTGNILNVDAGHAPAFTR